MEFSAVTIVSKADDTARFCVDYLPVGASQSLVRKSWPILEKGRHILAVGERKTHLCPRSESILSYFRVEEEKELAAFVTSTGKGLFNRLPFSKFLEWKKRGS